LRSWREERMNGWNIGVYRQAEGGSTPATAESVRGVRVAVWQTSDDGRDWILKLV
jgi:hypothetical protein